MEGIFRTRVGYAGGKKENPTYHNLGEHTETLQLDYDPHTISYEELLAIFWKSHTPATRAFSRQYMSIIFCHNEIQRELALKSKIHEEKRKNEEFFTKILPLASFHLAETYHQKYYLQSISELMQDFRIIYPNWFDFINSTAAARVNGYIIGYGSIQSLRKELEQLGLSEAGKRNLLEIVEQG